MLAITFQQKDNDSNHSPKSGRSSSGAKKNELVNNLTLSFLLPTS